MTDTPAALAAAAPSAPAPEATPTSNNAPLDPAVMKMVDYHVDCTVWSFVDNEATMKELEEAKKANPNAVHHWKDHRCYRQNPGEIAAAKAAIKNLNPQDAIEAMLASQLTAVHLASIECLNRASWVTDNIENRLAYPWDQYHPLRQAWHVSQTQRLPYHYFANNSYCVRHWNQEPV